MKFSDVKTFSDLMCWMNNHDWRNGPGQPCVNCGETDVILQGIIQSQKEAATLMTKESALNLFARSNDWLRERLQENATCSCGACYLCAYRYFESRP